MCVCTLPISFLDVVVRNWLSEVAVTTEKANSVGTHVLKIDPVPNIQFRHDSLTYLVLFRARRTTQNSLVTRRRRRDILYTDTHSKYFIQGP